MIRNYKIQVYSILYCLNMAKTYCINITICLFNVYNNNLFVIALLLLTTILIKS